MILSESHIIRSNHPYYKEIDALSFQSKNLYNYSLYNIRQQFFNNGTFLSYIELYRQIRGGNDYRVLPDKVSKGTLRKLYDNFRSFFRANEDYKAKPNKYKGKPNIPKYLPKKTGRFMVIYEKDALNHRDYKKNGLIKLSKTNIEIKSKAHLDDILQVHIVKLNRSYKIIVIYKDDLITENIEKNDRYACIDLGVNNLATLVSNIDNFKPVIYSGKRLKSLNQGYNRNISRAQADLPYLPKDNMDSYYQKGDDELVHKQVSTSNRIGKMYDRRKWRIDYYLHCVSSDIVDLLVLNSIDTLIVGYNKGWKQEVNIGKVNNQKFVNTPYTQLINQLRYKCARVGIYFVTISEAYTSKCSFIDNEPVRKHKTYKGERLRRGLFRSNSGRLINADVNGAYNILRLYLKNVSLDFKYKVGAVVVSTVDVKVY